MADKKNKPKKKTKVWRLISEDGKYVNFLLVFLSITAMIIASYLMLGKYIVIQKDFPVIGQFPEVTALVLFISGFVGLVLGVWPIYKPSVKEIKRLSPPTKKTYGIHVVRVFTFIIGLTLVFTIYDSVISFVFRFFK